MANSGFIAGPVAFKTLGRMSFAQLQESLFPAYFAVQAGSTAVALIAYLVKYQDRGISNALKTGFAQLLCTLLGASVFQATILGPYTTRVMHERRDFEKRTGESRDAPGPELRELNKKFGMLHGVSVLINLAFTIGTLAGVARIGTRGL